ncbi:hypothetical protein [Stieleria mannarensis]|uniref:hypothetical protein n=1 Tax=Stieleria mannarensis TaxID=2755585 RepID=UPI00160396B0|nr:hypothetical protein [Rhodopirellula sp. JC639]
MIRQFHIWHLIVATTVAALLFATLQLPASIAQALVVVVVFGTFHVLIARRCNCYESVFAGAVAALLVATFFSSVNGGWSLGNGWIGMFLDPMSILRWITMATVGGFVQVNYVHAFREQQRQFQRVSAGSITEAGRDAR